MIKQSIFSFAFCIVASTSSAQVSVRDVGKIHQKSLPTLFDMKYFKVADNQCKPSRTKSSGVYYKRPKGAYYGGFGLNGYGYYGSTINLVPWQEVVYENMIPGKAGIWHQYFYDQSGNNMGDIQVNPNTTVVDGDYTWSQDPGRQYYTPTLRLGRDSFCIGEENLYLKYYNRPQYAGRTLTDSIGMKIPADDHQRYYYNGQNYGNTTAWGALSDNMFGTGETDVTMEDNSVVTCPCYQVEQVMERPLSNLYVEKVVASGSSFKRQPIAEGDTLYCHITNVVRVERTNGTVQLRAGDQIYETLYAVAEDTLGFSMDNADTRNGKTIYEGKILFSKKEVDASGIECDVPIVINPYDFDENGFAIVIDGFEKSTIDFGLYGWRVNDDVDDIEPGRFSVYNPNTGDTYTFTYNGCIAMQVGLLSMYDAIEVLENGMNYLRISNDGQTCSTDGTVVGSDNDLGGAAIYTAQPWFDKYFNEYYHFENMPSWITDVIVDESLRDGDGQGQYVGLDFVAFKCSPLPNGVSGRSAILYLKGRGVTSGIPVYVMQGDSDVAETSLFSADNVEIRPSGTSEINVSFKNGSFEVNGYQFDLILPDGISLSPDEEGDFAYTLSDRYTKKENMQVTIRKVSENQYKVVCFSLTNEQLVGQDGLVISLGIKADSSVDSGVYNASFTNVVFSTTDGNSVSTGNVYFTIHVSSFDKGDVNNDGSIDVTDVMLVVNHILGNVSANFHEDYADLNGDKRIDVSDVMLIVNTILGNVPARLPEIPRTPALDDIMMAYDGSSAILSMDNMSQYTAFQMEVQMPEGSVMQDVVLDNKLSSTHKVLMNHLGGGLYKVLCYSLTGENFSGEENGCFLRIIADKRLSKDIKVSNILFTNKSFETVSFQDVNGTTGVRRIEKNSNADDTYYNINGVTTKVPTRGVYIKDGDKILVK